MEIKLLRPWLDEERNFKSASKIERDSKDWTPKHWGFYEKDLVEKKVVKQDLWEIYLKRHEVYQREQLLNPEVYDVLATDEFTTSDLLGDEKEKRKPSPQEFHLSDALGLLSKREREVVIGTFWNGKTGRELAAKLGISQGSISAYKKTAVKKIKKFLEEIDREIEIQGELIV